MGRSLFGLSGDAQAPFLSQPPKDAAFTLSLT